MLQHIHLKWNQLSEIQKLGLALFFDWEWQNCSNLWKHCDSAKLPWHYTFEYSFLVKNMMVRVIWVVRMVRLAVTVTSFCFIHYSILFWVNFIALQCRLSWLCILKNCGAPALHCTALNGAKHWVSVCCLNQFLSLLCFCLQESCFWSKLLYWRWGWHSFHFQRELGKYDPYVMSFGGGRFM